MMFYSFQIASYITKTSLERMCILFCVGDWGGTAIGFGFYPSQLNCLFCEHELRWSSVVSIRIDGRFECEEPGEFFSCRFVDDVLTGSSCYCEECCLLRVSALYPKECVWSVEKGNPLKFLDMDLLVVGRSLRIDAHCYDMEFASGSSLMPSRRHFPFFHALELMDWKMMRGLVQGKFARAPQLGLSNASMTRFLFYNFSLMLKYNYPMFVVKHLWCHSRKFPAVACLARRLWKQLEGVKVKPQYGGTGECLWN